MRSSICSGGLLVVLMLLHAAWAQAPTTIGYQGVLTDGGGTAVVDGTHALSFGLYEAASGGTAVWTETQTVATVNGVFQASLGSVTELSIDFDRALWLGIGVDGGAELSPRVELTGSPYSLIARSVADGAVTVGKLADGAVTSAKIVDGTVGSLDLGAGAVTASRVADGAITSAKIADGSIRAADVATGQVVTGVNGLQDAVTLAAGSNVTITPSGNTLTIASVGGSGGGELADGAVTGAKIADGGVGRVDLANGAVSAAKLQDGAVTGAKIADGTIAADDLGDGAVTGGKLADGSVSAVKLADGSVTGLKIAASAVTSVQIVDGSITAGDIGGGQVVKSVNGLQDAVTFVAGSNVTITPSGNSLSISANMGGGAGTGDIADNAITASKILDGAVTGAKLLDGTVGSGDLADGAVTGAKIAGGAVGSADLANDAVSSAKVQNGAITGVKIADGAVGTGDLAADAVTGAKIADGSVGAADLAANAVTGSKVADGTLGAADVASGQVVTGVNGLKDEVTLAAGANVTITPSGNTLTIGSSGSGALADDAVTSAKIADGTIAAGDIGGSQVVKSVNGLQDAVTFVAGSNVTITPSGNSLSISANMGGGAGTGDIADNAITASKILDGAVTGAKILDGTIASGDLAADAVTGVKIADGSIDAGDLANDAVSSAKVQNGAITGVKIADGAVGSTDLADGSVTGAKIADGTVAAADLADGAVTSAKIVDGAVGSTDLSADAVTGAKIADGAVASGDLADGSVTSAKIVDGAVGAADLSADAVTGAKIADGTVAAADLSSAAVTSAKIADGTIVTADLGTGVVTTAQVQDGSITSAKIADGTVGSADIGGGQVVKSVNGLQDALTLAAGSNVTITPSGNTLTIASSGGGSLADDAVTSAKIADGAVGSADLAANAVTGGKIADGTIAAVDVAGGQVVKSVNGLKDAVTLVAGSNVTITPSGNSLSISASTGGGVGTGDIADNAITTAKILDGAVTSAKIIDGTVVSGDLANGAVTSAKLASSAVTSAKIADGTIASGDLAADAVVSAKLADGSVTSAKIVDGTIAAGDLAADAVITAKLADGSVTSAKIADGTIAAGDIGAAQVVKSVNGLLDAVTLAAGTNVTITPSGNTLTFASGDLADGSVTSAKIADGGVATVDLANDAVSTAKLADGSVTGAKILDGTIASGDLAGDAVVTAKLADGSVTSAKIADGTIAAGDIGADAIISAKIADGTIASGDLAADAVVSAKIADGTIVAGDIGAAQVVKSVSGLTDAVTLAAGTNVTITPSGNTLTFAAGGPGNTLDGAYDQGGAGAGRTITADNGAVDIAGAGGLTVNGSAGIGTTSPGGKIGVNGDVSSNEIATLVAASASTNFATDYPYLALINTDATTNNYARIDFRDTDGSVSVASLAGVFTDHTNDYGDLAFLTRNAGGFGEKMRLSSSGNLGIGIAGPRVPLDVVRTTTGSGQILQVGSLSFYKDATPTKAADIGMYPVGGAITDDLVFSLFDGASWSERMRISNNGNVGIGTTTPDVRLDLVGDANGALRITSNETDATAKVLNLIGSQYTNANGSWHIIGGQASNTANSMRIGGGYSGYDAATEVRFYTGAAVNTDTGTERMRIDASGRVGIGTSTPDDAKLEIVNTSSGNAATGLMLINEATAAGTATRLDFTPNTDTTVPLARIEANRTAVGGATDLIFLTSTNGAPVSEKMRINTSGNVGIGVASPTSMLHITDNTTPADNEWASIKAFANGNSFIWGHSNTEYDNAIGTLNGGGNPFISFFSYHGGTANTLKYSSGTIPPGRFLYSAGVQLYYDTAAAGTQDADIATWNTRLTILNDGKIGIGTTTPAEKLSIEEGHINLNHSSIPYMRIQRAGAEHGYIGSAGALFGGTQTDFGVRAESNLIFGTSSAEYMRLTSGGKFGIGETSPTKRLHVKDASVAVAAFNRTGDDGPIISIQQDGAEEGTISVAVNTVSYNAFTGSHYAWTDREIEMGTLVRLTGENRRLHDAAESEILYGVAPSTRANDPAILGAYLQLQESMQPAGADNPHLVMAVGNGVMWVVDNGEDIGIGDYLVSADLEGHAMRDPGSYETSYVVARAAEPVCWEGVDEMAGGRKRRKISVFFESFAYNHSLEKIEKLQTENRALSRSNERLEAKVAKLAAAVRRLEALIAVQKSVESEDGALVAVE